MAIQLSPIVPGATQPSDVRGPSASSDYIWNAAETFDNVVDGLVGIRPARHVGRVVCSLGPANIIRNVTGLPKPSELVEDLEGNIEGRLRRFSLGRELPRPPAPPRF